jgi:hypothetical protein
MVGEDQMKKRHIELDIARGVAVFLMILQHCWIMFSSEKIVSSIPTIIIYLLGTLPAAPIFLFLLGVNIINSHWSDPKRLLVRGLKLFGLGYVLSAVSLFLPIVLGQRLGLIDASLVAYHWPVIDYLLEVNIFHVAGLSLMGIALLRQFKVKYQYYLILAVLTALVSPFLWQINFSNIIVSRLFDPFFGTGNYVLFPFFSWFFYPLAGVYFGDLLVKAKNKTDFYRGFFVKLLPVIFVGIIILLFNTNFPFPFYSHHRLGASLLFVTFIIYWLAIINVGYKHLSEAVANRLIFWSKNVTLIYIVQWIVIGWLAVFGNFHFGYLYLIILTVLIFIVVNYLVFWLIKIKKNKKVNLI